jgi:hypothetical protein
MAIQYVRKKILKSTWVIDGKVYVTTNGDKKYVFRRMIDFNAVMIKLHGGLYQSGITDDVHPQGRIQGGGGGAPGAHPPKIGKNKICWRKIVIFHTKYPPKKFKCAPLTWNPGSAPDPDAESDDPLMDTEVKELYS